MEKNEIKKKLYKEKPLAIFLSAKKGYLNYSSTFKDSSIVNFRIPFEDIGDGIFDFQMDAKLLIRWINN